MNINMDNLFASLNLMWQGMLGIFAVMAVIAVIVYLFTKIQKKK